MTWKFCSNLTGSSAQHVRLPSELSREYETYMQKRLRMMSQPRPQMVTGVSVSLVS